MNGLRRAALKGTAWSALQQGGDRGIRILIYLVLARLVAPDAFGIVALAAVFIEFGQILLNQGLTAAIVQREELEPAHLDSAFWGNVLFGLAAGVLVYAGAGGIARLAREPAIEPVVRWLALAFPIAALSSVQESVLRRSLDFRALALRSVISQVTAGGVSLGMAVAGMGVWSLVALELVRRGVAAVVLWSVSDWRPGRGGSLRHYVELLQFGIPIMGVALLEFFKNRSDYYLIGAFLGTTSLGFYSIARQLVNAVTSLLNGSVVEVMWPTYSRLQSDPARLARAIGRATELLALIAWPIYVGGLAIAPELVPLVLGDRWIPSVPIAQAFLLRSVLLVIAGSLMTAITAVGHTRTRFRLELLTAGATLTAIGVSLPFGIVAVACAYVAALAILLPIQAGIAFRLLPAEPREFWNHLAAPALGCLAILATVHALRVLVGDLVPAVGMMAAMILAGGLVYWIVLTLVAPGQVKHALDDVRLLVKRGPDSGSSAGSGPDSTSI